MVCSGSIPEQGPMSSVVLAAVNQHFMNYSQFSQELVGKFVNRYLYTDIQHVGKIVSLKGKTILLVELYEKSENKTKMEFVTGGFSAICLNDSEQKYDFSPTGEVVEIRFSKQFLKQNRIEDKPREYYDFNF
jgi:hypothetical protein